MLILSGYDQFVNSKSGGKFRRGYNLGIKLQG